MKAIGSMKVRGNPLIHLLKGFVAPSGVRQEASGLKPESMDVIPSGAAEGAPRASESAILPASTPGAGVFSMLVSSMPAAP